MNFKFEKDLLLTALKDKTHDFIFNDYLDSLRNLKLAIDASLLLEMSKDYANPQKYIQEGGACLDF